MKQYKTYKKSIVRLCLLSVAIIILFLLLFLNSVFKANDEQINFEISKINSEAEAGINSHVTDLFNRLTNDSKKFESGFNGFNDETIEKLNSINSEGDYFKLSIINRNAAAYTNDGKSITFLEYDFIYKALDGENSISGLINIPEFSKELIAFAVPIKNGDKIIGVMAALITPEAIGEFTGYKTDGKNTYIINKMGTIINSSEDNFFALLSNFHFDGEFSKTDFENDLFHGNSNMFTYTENSVKKHAYYKPYKSTGWFLVSCVENDYISGGFSFELKQFYLLAFRCCLILFLLFGYNAIAKKKYIKESYICQESFAFFKKNSILVFFEINPETHEAFFSENIAELVGFSPRLPDVTDEQIMSDSIHKDDIVNVKKYFEDILLSKTSGEIEFRFRTGLNNYMPVRVVTSTVLDRKKRLLRIIGSLSTAEEQCLLSSHSGEISRRDPLTNLTNKLGTKSQVDEYCNSNLGEKGALLIAEITNLNEILSAYNSNMIDNMIIESVENMLKLFRSTDIIGRTGESEFAILMKKVEDESLIIEKATAVQRIFNNTAVKAGIADEIIITIGISRYSDDANDFTGLYKKSNNAVSQADEHNGRIIFFNSNEAMSESEMM